VATGSRQENATIQEPVPSVENQPENPMNLSFSLKNLLPLLAIILGIASIVAPRFLNVFVAVFLIAFGILGLGLVR
jgi:Protein of unknown function (DUF3096)